MTSERITPRATRIYPAIHTNVEGETSITAQSGIGICLTVPEAIRLMKKLFTVIMKPGVKEIKIRCFRRDLHIGVFATTEETIELDEEII